MKKSSFEVTAQPVAFDYAKCISPNSNSTITSDANINNLNDFKSRYPYFFNSVISKLSYNGYGTDCLDNTSKMGLSTEQRAKLEAIKGKFDNIIPDAGKCGPIGTLTNGYDVREVRQVYKNFFVNPQLCLFYLGTLVENDQQFLFYILESLLGISKPMLDYLRDSDNAVYGSLLKIATLYIKTVSGQFVYETNAKIVVTAEQKRILTDGTLDIFLNKIIDVSEEPMILAYYSDVLSRFQSLVEDCFVETYKIEKKWNKTLEHSKTIIDVYKKVIVVAELNITSTNLRDKITRIINHKKSLFDKFDSLISIFNNELSAKLTELNRNKRNRDYIQNLAASQFYVIDNAREIQREMGASFDFNSLFVRALGSGNLQVGYYVFCILIQLYISSVYDMLIDMYADMATKEYLYYNSDGSPIIVTLMNGETTNIDSLLKSIIESVGSHIYGIYFSISSKYLNYINNYLLGLKRTGANRSAITALLSLPEDAKFSHIRDNMYVSLVHRAQQMSNAYMLMAQTCSLSADPAELYDFPHDFKSLTNSFKNKYEIIISPSTPLFALTTVNQFARNGNNIDTFRNISRFSSKSNFGEDEFTASLNNALYSHELTSLEDQLSSASPDITTIRALVAMINATTDTSGVDYTNDINNINTKIGLLNTASVGVPDIGLLGVPDATTDTTATPSTSDNNLTMYLIPLVILIGLIILFYLMNKKKY